MDSNGYIQIQYKKKLYLAHRLAWWYIHNEYPDQIDHIDRDKTNNTIHNLRNVTKSQNQQNRRSLNYSYDKTTGFYRVRIRVNNKYINVGSYKDLKQAQQSAENAKKLYHSFYTEGGQ